MSNVKRSKHIFLSFHDERAFDVEKFLEGTIHLLAGGTKIRGFSGLRRRFEDLEKEDIELLAQISSESWTAINSLAGSDDELSRVNCLLRSGFLVTDGPSGLAMLCKEELLVESYWNSQAWLWHSFNILYESTVASLTEELDFTALLADASESAEKFIEKRGIPEPIFPSRADSSTETLQKLSPPAQAADQENALLRVLLNRRTVRSFAQNDPLSEQDISTLLAYTFGAWGIYEISPNYRLQHRTSPSGGGLHPVEAYPIILRASGLSPGVYHYQSESNSLLRLQTAPVTELRSFLVAAAHGQIFTGEAAMVVILVARFKRNFWKYRDRPNTYNVIVSDTGHLNQTFSLVATSLQLGSFYTAALDHELILDFLKLDPVHFGPMGLAGAGKIASDEQAMDMRLNHSFSTEPT